MQVFAFPHRDRPVLHVPVPGRWVDSEPGRLLVVPAPFVFEYCSSLVPCGSEADRAHIWRIAILDFLVFALVSFLATGGDGVFMSRRADSSIVADG